MPETSELTTTLRAALSSEKTLTSRHIVLYTSFGVVKGRTTLAFARQSSEANLSQSEILELIEVTVEHYSSHLPTASFDQLYVRFSDIRAFSVANLKGQG